MGKPRKLAECFGGPFDGELASYEGQKVGATVPMSRPGDKAEGKRPLYKLRVVDISIGWYFAGFEE